MRAVLLTSLMTGGFCALFAGVVDAVTDALTVWQVMMLGGISGLSGSLIAQLILGRSKG